MGNVLDFPELCIVQEKPEVRYPQLIYQIRERKIDLSRKDFDLNVSYAVRENNNPEYHIGYISVSQIVNEIALTFNISERKAHDWFKLWFYATLKVYEEFRKSTTNDGTTLHKPVVKS